MSRRKIYVRGERCWAYLHDVNQCGVHLILDAFRQATLVWGGIYANPFAGEV